MNDMTCSLFRMPSTGAELGESQRNLFHAARLALSGQLLSAILHELQQPLIAMRLRARNGRDLLAAGDHSSEAIHEIFRDIEGCAAFATDIASRLRLLSDKRPLELEPLDLNEAIREVAVIAEIQAKACGVTLELRLAPHLPRLNADRVSIQHAVLDLVINGIEALGEHDERRVIVETSARGGHAEVSVRDTGPGVARKIRGRLFEPFFTTKPEGTGLGLAIAKAIVDAHGGCLEVVDPPARGACFRIRLSLPIDDE